MRVFRGQRQPDGTTRVWVDDELEPPTPGEIADLLGDLRPLRDSWSDDSEWEIARNAWMARKHNLLARIEAAKTPQRRPLLDTDSGQADRFDWGRPTAGATALAYALLHHHLGVEPTEPVINAFRDTVIAGFDTDRLYAPASLISAWVSAHRQLVEHELFLREPQGRANAVIDAATPIDGVDAAVDPATASQLVAACETAWDDIRVHHPDLPSAVVVLGTGIERGRLVKLGHWWGGQWVADGQSRGEVLLAGEALHLGPNVVFEILLHEAAHGINAARGIKDTSRGGRYHNRRFADTARQVLLDVQPLPPYGLARTALTPAAEERYADTIERLGDAIRIARQIRRGIRIGDDTDLPPPGGGPDQPGEEGGDTKRKDNGAAACGCGRKLRMAPSTLAAGPVTCGLCHTDFQPVVATPQTPTAEADRADADRADAVVDDTFVARRRAELAAGTERSTAPAGALSARPDPGDAEAVGRWYADFGTEHEHPMPATDRDEADRRDRMARAILRADGTLAGPTVTTRGGFELQAGDRVHAPRDLDDLPAGTLGTVEQVDPTTRSVDIDFATWGRLHAQLEDDILRDLEHDYAHVSGHAADTGLELPGMEP